MHYEVEPKVQHCTDQGWL